MASRRHLLVLVALAGLAVSGCANIPTGGPVKVVDRAAAGGITVPNLTVFGQLPVPGESAPDLVRGFLQAVANYTNHYERARSYLTATAAARWQGIGAEIYDVAGLAVSAPVHGVVSVTAPLVGRLDAEGEYQPASGTMTYRFGVVKRDGDWRIESLPAAPLLSVTLFQDTYRAVKTYFLSSAAPVVVPDPVYLPVPLDNLATALVSVLLTGPTDTWSAALRTAVPKGTSLTGPVSINAGVANVPLSRQVAQMSPSRYRLMSAQLVWTLQQLGVSAVRVAVAGGTPGPAFLPVSAYLGFSPNVASSFAAYATYDGQVVRLTDRGPAPIRDTRGLTSPAVSADGRLLAGVVTGPSGETLVEGQVGGPLKQVISFTAGVVSPSFAAGDVLWAAVDLRLGHQEVIRVLPGGDVQEVLAPGFENRGRISDLAVSRDGSRVAAVVGTNLLVGAVASSADGPMVQQAFSLLPPGEADGGLSWQDASTLAVLVSVTQGAGTSEFTEPVRVSVDGSNVTPVDPAGLPPTQLTQLAAAPEGQMMVAAAGTLFQLGQPGWLPLLSHAADPAFAGG